MSRMSQYPKTYLNWLNGLFSLHYERYGELADCVAYNIFIDFITKRGTSLYLVNFPSHFSSYGTLNARITNLNQARQEASCSSDTRSEKMNHVEFEDTLEITPKSYTNLKHNNSLRLNGSVENISKNMSMMSQTANEDDRKKELEQDPISIDTPTFQNVVSFQTLDEIDKSMSMDESQEFFFPLNLAQMKENQTHFSEVVMHHKIHLPHKLKKLITQLNIPKDSIHYHFSHFCYTYWKRYFSDISIVDYKPVERIREAYKISEDNRRVQMQAEEIKLDHEPLLDDEAHYRRAFKIIDRDGNGELDYGEIQEFASTKMEEGEMSDPKRQEALVALMQEAKGDAPVLTEDKFVQFMKKQREEQLELERKEREELERRLKSSEEGIDHPMVLQDEDLIYYNQMKKKNLERQRQRKLYMERQLRLEKLALPFDREQFSKKHAEKYSFKPEIIKHVPLSSRRRLSDISNQSSSQNVENNRKKANASHVNKKKKTKKSKHKDTIKKLEYKYELPPLTSKVNSSRRKRSSRNEGATYKETEKIHKLKEGESIISAAIRERNERHTKNKMTIPKIKEMMKQVDTKLSKHLGEKRKSVSITKHVVSCKSCGVQLEHSQRNSHLCDLSEMIKFRRHSQPNMTKYDQDSYLQRLWKRASEEREKFANDFEDADPETDRILQSYYNFQAPDNISSQFINVTQQESRSKHTPRMKKHESPRKRELDSTKSY